MQEQLNKAMQQFQKTMEPARKLNALLLDHAEKIAHLNLEAARAYNNLALEQMRAALEVRDPETFQTYLNNQGKMAQTFSNKLTEDATAFADLNKNMGEEVQKIAQENVAVLTDTMRSAQAEAQQSEKPKSRAAAGASSAASTAAKKTA